MSETFSQKPALVRCKNEKSTGEKVWKIGEQSDAICAELDRDPMQRNVDIGEKLGVSPVYVSVVRSKFNYPKLPRGGAYPPRPDFAPCLDGLTGLELMIAMAAAESVAMRARDNS